MKQKIAVAALFVVGALLLSAFGGYVFGNMRGVEQERARHSDDADAARFDQAKKRIAELERQLAAAQSALAKKRAAKAERRSPPAVPVPAHDAHLAESGAVIVAGSDIDVIGELKRQLPEEQFMQATNALAQMRVKLANRAKSRMDFLKSLDVGGMSKADRANHAKFLDMMAKREAAAAKMKGGFPDAKVLEEMVTLDMEMRPLAKAERSALVREIARELGYAGEDAEVLHDTLDAIFDSTSPGGLDGLMDAVDGQPGLSIQTEVIGL